MCVCIYDTSDRKLDERKIWSSPQRFSSLYVSEKSVFMLVCHNWPCGFFHSCVFRSVRVPLCRCVCVCEHVLSNIQQRSAELPVKVERSKGPVSGSKVTADLSPISSLSSVTGRRDDIHKQAGKVCIYMQTSPCQCILPLTSGIHDLRPFQNNSAPNLCPFLTSPPTSLPPFPFKHLHGSYHYSPDLTLLSPATFSPGSGSSDDRPKP